MIHFLPEIHWGSLNNFMWFPVIVVACVVVLYRYSKQCKAYAVLAGSRFALLRNVSPKKQIARVVLLCIAFLFLFIAILRPQWNKSEEMVMQEGRDLYIGLDISRSMLAVDCKPNRLVYAKEKIKKLLKNLSCERVGLILFSGSAFVQCPLTSDYSAFYLYLDAVDAELISSGTTALDKAIQQALQSFSTMPDRKNKLLVLFTDGEDFSHNLSGIKKEAAQENLSIFTIGIGTTEGAPVPLFDAHGVQVGHQKDAKGNVVISRLNEGILHALSHDAGGHYIRATSNDDDIFTFVRAVQSREKEVIGERKIARFEDQYHYFLLVSFICLALEWLL
jgi:Ca-activated chloride channel family protein